MFGHDLAALVCSVSSVQLRTDEAVDLGTTNSSAADKEGKVGATSSCSLHAHAPLPHAHYIHQPMHAILAMPLQHACSSRQLKLRWIGQHAKGGVGRNNIPARS